MDYLQQIPVAEIVNVHWGQLGVGLRWSFAWRNLGGGNMEEIGPVPGISSSTDLNYNPNWVDGWEFTSGVFVFQDPEEEWTQNGSVRVSGSTELSFGFGTEGGITLGDLPEIGSPQLGVGAGSAGPFTVSGQTQDGILLYRHTSLGVPTFLYGFGVIGPSSYTSIEIEWDNISFTHDASGDVWPMESYTFGQFIAGIGVVVLILDFTFDDPNDPED